MVRMVSAIDTLLSRLVVTPMIYHNFQAFSNIARPVRAIAELAAAPRPAGARGVAPCFPARRPGPLRAYRARGPQSSPASIRNRHHNHRRSRGCGTRDGCSPDAVLYVAAP